MIHFAAAYGLAQTIAAFVQYCPTASRALALKNKDGLRPKEIAEENGHSELSEELRDFEVVLLFINIKRWQGGKFLFCRPRLTLQYDRFIRCILP